MVYDNPQLLKIFVFVTRLELLRRKSLNISTVSETWGFLLLVSHTHTRKAAFENF